MKVTIEGDRFQIRAALPLIRHAMATPKSLYPKRQDGAASLARKRVAEEYKLLGEAFKKARKDPALSEMAQRLLAGISDLSKRTPELLLEAKILVESTTSEQAGSKVR